MSSQFTEPCRRVCAMRALCHENSWRISVCPVPEGAGMCCRLEPWLLTLCSGSRACTTSHPSRTKWLPISPLLWEVLFSTEKIILYFKPWDVASREEKKKFNIWVLVLTWPPANPGQGRRQGQPPVPNGGEDTHGWMEGTRHVKCHLAWSIQYPQCCWWPSRACGLNSAITNAWHYADTQISINIIDFSKFSSELITVI